MILKRFVNEEHTIYAFYVGFFFYFGWLFPEISTSVVTFHDFWKEPFIFFPCAKVPQMRMPRLRDLGEKFRFNIITKHDERNSRTFL